MKASGKRVLLLVVVVTLGCGKSGGTEPSGGSTGGSIGTGTGASDANLGGDSGSQCPTGTWIGMPWSLRTQAASTGGSGGVGGAAGAGGGGGGPSSCTSSPTSDGSSNLSCVGTAQVSGGASAPQLILGDGSELDYDPQQAPTLGPPALGSGEVTVKYAWRQVLDCSYCGSRSQVSLEIRSVETGQLLFAEANSAFGNGVRTDILAEVLGATPVPEPGCTYSTGLDCTSFQRSEYSYVAPTTPPLRLPHGQVTRWRSPAGVVYDMMISSSADSAIVRNPNCMDGREIVADSKYLVSQVTE